MCVFNAFYKIVNPQLYLYEDENINILQDILAKLINQPITGSSGSSSLATNMYILSFERTTNNSLNAVKINK